MKKLIALLMAAMLIFSFAACGKEEPEETTAEETTEAIIEETEEATEAEVTEAAEGEAEATEAEAAEETTEAEAAEEVTAPTDKEEIVNLFNDSVNGAVAAKAGFSKARKTELLVFSPDNLFNLPIVGETVKNTVYDFLGVGTINATNAKGQTADPALLKRSTLSAGDVSSATCTVNNGVYDITLNLNSGNSTETSYGNTALDRSPICTGAGDNSGFDHKTGENYYSGINNGESSCTGVTESYNNAVIKAKVDAESGKITSLIVTFNFSADLKGIKYKITIGDASGKAATTVTYSNFNY